MAKKRQYANSNPVRLNPVSFEMIEDNKERYRVVKGEVAAIYSKMVHVCVKAGRSAYNECFLKTDLYRWQFNVK